MLRIALEITVILAACGSYLVGDERYFPTGAFDKDDKENDDKVKRYGEYLEAMSEPSLWELSMTDQTIASYRLLWLPAFQPAIAVRAAKSDKSITIHIVTLESAGGGKPGKVVSKHTRKMTDDEWTLLQIALEKSTYWKLRTSVKGDLAAGVVMDGDRLICEGVDSGRYHVVDRSDAEPEYEKMCKFLLGLSGLDIRKAWAEYHDDVD
jgi:hypothetical protein